MSRPSWKPLDVAILAPGHGGTGRARRSVLRWPQGLAYGQVKKQYKGRGIERVDVRVVHGKARLKHVLYLLGYKVINTSAVERHNGTSRLRNQRKVRKTLAFSKATRYHRWMSWLAVGLYNFCHAHRSLKIQHEATGLCIGARPWQQSSPTISGRLGSGCSALSWEAEMIPGHYPSEED